MASTTPASTVSTTDTTQPLYLSHLVPPRTRPPLIPALLAYQSESYPSPTPQPPRPRFLYTPSHPTVPPQPSATPRPPAADLAWTPSRTAWLWVPETASYLPYDVYMQRFQPSHEQHEWAQQQQQQQPDMNAVQLLFKSSTRRSLFGPSDEEDVHQLDDEVDNREPAGSATPSAPIRFMSLSNTSSNSSSSSSASPNSNGSSTRRPTFVGEVRFTQTPQESPAGSSSSGSSSNNSGSKTFRGPFRFTQSPESPLAIDNNDSDYNAYSFNEPEADAYPPMAIPVVQPYYDMNSNIYYHNVPYTYYSYSPPFAPYYPQYPYQYQPHYQNSYRPRYPRPRPQTTEAQTLRPPPKATGGHMTPPWTPYNYSPSHLVNPASGISAEDAKTLLVADPHHPALEVDTARVENGQEKRTTVMIRNLPNTSTQADVIKYLDGCIKNDGYDVVYVPVDFHSTNNFGYGFVNLTDPKLVLPLLKGLEGKRFPGSFSNKLCHICFCRIQGYDALWRHYHRSKMTNLRVVEWRPFFKTLEIPEVSMPVHGQVRGQVRGVAKTKEDN